MYISTNLIKRNLIPLAAVGLVAVTLFFTLPKPSATAQRGGGGELNPETVFTNAANIDINTTTTSPTVPLPFTPYPSPITVSGLTGNITKVTVSIYGINDPRPPSFDILLVGPTGANLIIASDIGNDNTAVADVAVTFDDAATTGANSTGLGTATIRPTNLNIGGADTFPAPAPAGPYFSPAPTGSATFASVFNGTNPNGDWKIYVVQDEVASQGSAGFFANGWSVNVTTSASPATNFTNPAAIVFDDFVAPATPYPSTINVAGMAGVVSNIKVTLNNYSHQRPTDTQMLLVSPTGRPFVLMSNAGGTSAATNVNVTFDDAATTGIPNPIVTGTYRPSSSGTFSLPAPAPPPPYLSAFTGLNTAFGKQSPNGVWSLYIADNQLNMSGSISGGWSLDITTTPNVPTQFGCSIASFLPPAAFAAGTGPTGLASADFNGDTKPDLAVANQSSNNVSILLNNGSGGFNAPTNFAAGSAPYQVATAKFNGDVFDDLVVVNGGSNNISILLGDGMGGFGSPTNFAAGPNPISVTIADFNNDGKQDLGVADFGGFFAGTVAVLLGNGAGSFGAPALFGARTQPAAIAAADFNNDTKQDLAVANFGSNNISILLGSGTGTFTYFSTLTAGVGPVSLIVMDHNADGKADLSVANYNGSNALGYLGVGDG
ncbi:MAG: VCBS repeat-containing protein, partial [Pyrinomonadaceae bacterium]